MKLDLIERVSLKLMSQVKSPVTVIRKRLKMLKRQESTEKAFKKEMESLELLRCLQHGNIIELLGSYTHKTEHNFLFPLLPLDLSEFLQCDKRYGRFDNNMTFYDALRGLSSALKTIHDFNLSIPSRQSSISRIGYHHDIRPKNILVTECTFKLADFGLASFKNLNEDSKTRWKSGIGDYIAPECMDGDLNHLQTGRSIDIWSFGCLLAEIAAYMEGGPPYVADFRKERTCVDNQTNWTNHYFFEGNGIKSSVKSFLEGISRVPLDQGICCLARVARELLHVNIEDRARAPKLHRMLAYVHLKALYQSSRRMIELMGLAIHSSSQRTSSFHRIEVWVEAEKLKTWGKVIGMDTENADCALLRDYPTTISHLTPILTSIQIRLESLKARPRGLASSPCDDQDHSHLSQAPYPHAQLNEEVRLLIKDLWESAPIPYQRRMEQAWRQSLFDERSIDLSLVEDEVKDIYGDESGIGTHLALKRLEEALWREIDRAGPKQRNLILRSSQIERTGVLNRYHELGWYQPNQKQSPNGTSGRRRVILEWMLYSPVWGDQTDEEKVVKVTALVELLHHPKPQGFHVLDCLGVIPPTADSSHEGFGFVYAYPSDLDRGKDKEPTTLSKLLQTKGFTLLLDDKFRIAASLGSSIFELHSVAWLHKNIRSSNILLFLTDSKTQPSNAIKGSYLIGLHHSRPDGQTWISENNLFDTSDADDPASAYAHPNYNPGSTRFKKIFDFYALGVVLLELGFWQPIGSFKAQHPREDPSTFSRLLAERYVPKLGAKMGSVYRDVVMRCLESDFGEVEEEPGAEDELVGFYWNVVAKLEGCKVGNSSC